MFAVIGIIHDGQPTAASCGGGFAAFACMLQVLACLSDKQEQLKSSACRKEVNC